MVEARVITGRGTTIMRTTGGEEEATLRTKAEETVGVEGERKVLQDLIMVS